MLSLLKYLCTFAKIKNPGSSPASNNLGEGLTGTALQRYAFLLKEARNYWKMFEGEGDKKNKVYPRLPDMLSKEDTPYYIYERYMSDCLLYNLHGLVSTLQDKQAVARDIVLLELRGLHLAYLLTFCIIYIGIRRRSTITI